MSLGITHFALGGAVGYLLVDEYSRRTAKPANRSLGLIYGGIYALIPDLSKVYEPLEVLHHSVAADLFLFHHLLDKADPSNSVMAGIIALALLMAAVMGRAHYE